MRPRQKRQPKALAPITAETARRLPRTGTRTDAVSVSAALLVYTLEHARRAAENAYDITERITPEAGRALCPAVIDDAPRFVVRDRVLAAASHVATRELADPSLWDTVIWDFLADRIAARLNAGQACSAADIDAMIGQEAAELEPQLQSRGARAG